MTPVTFRHHRTLISDSAPADFVFLVLLFSVSPRCVFEHPKAAEMLLEYLPINVVLAASRGI